MARIPFARWKPLPAHGHEPSITPRTVIHHTMVGTLAGVDGYFRSGRSGGIESHVGVACARCEAAGVAEDGEVWQWMDTGEQADANYHANGFALSWETCDHYTGGTYTNPPLSPGQIKAWIRLGIWAHEEHGIPLRKCPAWDAGGYGWHAMWGSPSQWTPAVGKQCPNPTRIRQLTETVLPAIFAGRVEEEDDLPYTEAQLRTMIREEVTRVLRIAVGPDDASQPAGAYFERVDDTVQAIASRVTAIKSDVDTLVERSQP